MLETLDDSRLECVRGVRRVEANLGIEVDANEKYKESLEEKMADALMAKADAEIIRRGLEAGVITKAEL